ALRRRFGDFTLAAERDPHGFTTRLRAYFAGDLGALDGIPVDPGGTAFQQSVWRALREIPGGQTESYAGLAARIGRTRAASRAVGSANGANPVAIVIPCHRVIRSDSDLCGYAFGVERKRWLLAHEAARGAFALTAEVAPGASRAEGARPRVAATVTG
ncbi:MAG TPA: methylated-DNA--[protein]-cysteine S-methyltransferase, partial [Myxococcaceae bacterium]|nr:methylated-DNA--[protein]-cysteine S-methyltransferase [Myxococcaceae bacterium]